MTYMSNDLGPGSKTKVHKFGSVQGVGTTEQHIWPQSGDKTWETAAETVRIKSGGNAADTAAGNNARSVTIQGLDENFDFVEETVATAGASQSAATTATFSRVFRAFVATVGVYNNKNAGDITIENVTSQDVVAFIRQGMGQTEMTQYTVPRGYTAFLVAAKVSADGTQDGKVRMWQRQNADDWTSAPFSSPRLVTALNSILNAINVTVGSPISFPEKTDLWWSGAANAATTDIEIAYDLILVKKPT